MQTNSARYAGWGKICFMYKPTRLILLALTFLGVAGLTAIAPLEKTLGANARIVYLHGAWVWVALALFVLAGLAGAAGLALRHMGTALQSWSQALGRTALLFWITFLLMSLYVMQATWNGIFWDEPRFRIPLNFAVVGLLLQIGLSFFPLQWTALANALYAAALVVGMGGIQTVLHPEAPLASAGAAGIRLFFYGLLALLLLAGGQIANLWRPEPRTTPAA